MRQSRFTEAQIIGMIKEQEAGMSTAEVCRRYGLSTNPGKYSSRVLQSSGAAQGQRQYGINCGRDHYALLKNVNSRFIEYQSAFINNADYCKLTC